METAGHLTQPDTRPTRKLLEHCSTWQSSAVLERHSVWARLEDELGDDLAHRLVTEIVESERVNSTSLTD